MLTAFSIAKPCIARNIGFTLVEMMIVIAIIGIATAMGLPSFSKWVLNTQIRNAAESVQNGLQRTRAEAVARNANIEFVLGGAGTPWKIQLPGNLALCPNYGPTLIECSTSEGAKKATVVGVDKNGVVATTVTFNNFGRVGRLSNSLLNTDGTEPLTQVNFDLPVSVLSAADSRDLSVTISTGGSIRMCDPNLIAGSSPLAC